MKKIKLSGVTNDVLIGGVKLSKKVNDKIEAAALKHETSRQRVIRALIEASIDEVEFV